MQSNRFHAVPNRADNGNFGKFGATYLHGTVFHQSNDDIKRKLRGHGKPRNVIAFSVQKNVLAVAGMQKRNGFMQCRVRGPTMEFLGKFDATYLDDKVFAPKQW